MGKLSRRQFIHLSAVLGSGFGLGVCPAVSARPDLSSLVETRYYKKLKNGEIQCTLCPWNCVVKPGNRGRCQVRINQNGSYYSLVYGQIAALHHDPIEKKPFYHFLPGSTALSIATAGCNVSCKFCQNWSLAQRKPEALDSTAFTSERLIKEADQAGSSSIAYTYNEPIIYTEFIEDTAGLSRQYRIRNVMISNGFINPQPLRNLCKVIDAYKVDLKSFTESYYQNVVGGRLMPVLDTLITLRQENVWTEIVYLLVPNMNDSDQELKSMTTWVARELGPDVPVHFSRFYPQYKLRNLPPTPIATLEKAWKIGRDAGLHYVYLGNVPGHQGENTTCPHCQKVLIRRIGYKIVENHLNGNQCNACDTRIAGVWG